MQFDQLYKDRVAAEKYYNETLASGLAYDAIWALALGLNATQEMVDRNDSTETGCSNTSGRLVPLHEFDYGNEMMGCVVRWNLEQTSFIGVSVSTGTRSFLLGGSLVGLHRICCFSAE